MNKLFQKKNLIFVFALLFLFAGIMLCVGLNENTNAAKTSTFYFDANGGEFAEGESDSVTVTADSSGYYNVYFPKVERENYVFLGWGTAQYMLKDIKTTIKTITSYEGLTFYAQWDFEFTINFNFTSSWIIEKKFCYRTYYDGNKEGETENFIDFTEFISSTEFNALNEVSQGYVLIGWNVVPNAKEIIFDNAVKKADLPVSPNSVLNLYPVWRDTYINHYTKPKGSGTIDDPYLISNGNELAWMSFKAKNTKLEGYFKQTSNIDLSAYEWTPIGSSAAYGFRGNYDGNGFCISNLNVRGCLNSSYTGLFGYLFGDVSNLVIASGNISGALTFSNAILWAGAIAGGTHSAEIINCVNFAKINVLKSRNSSIGVFGHAGGLLGKMFLGELYNCANYGDMVGFGYIGGLIGSISQKGETIKNCQVRCTIELITNGKFNVKTGALFGIISANESEWHEKTIIENCVADVIELKNEKREVIETFLYGPFFSKSGYDVTYKNCFLKLKTKDIYDKVIRNSSENKNVIVEINDSKYYIGTDFSAWGVMPDGRVVLKELLHQGNLLPTPTTQWFEENGYIYP